MQQQRLRGRVVGVESAEGWKDGKQRVTIKVHDASSPCFDKLTIPNDGGFQLDDELALTIIVDPVVA